MKYLAPRDDEVLDVWLKKRDWTDLCDERHYEYHVQTWRNMAGSSIRVVVHAEETPWSIMLHGTLLLRLLKSPIVTSVLITGARRFGPVRALTAVMRPGMPPDVQSKIVFQETPQRARDNSPCASASVRNAPPSKTP